MALRLPTAATQLGSQQAATGLAGLAGGLGLPADTEPGGRPLGKPG